MKTNILFITLCLAIVMNAVSCTGSIEKTPASISTESIGNSMSGTSDINISAEDARQAVSDDIPKHDFGGASYRILTQRTTAATDAVAEEMTGEIINDTLYERNRNIEDCFNVKIDVATADADQIPDMITKSVNSGNDEYDIIMNHVIITAPLAANSMFYNMLDIPYIDFSKPWWFSDAMKDLTINNTIFVAAGDICLSIMERTYCVYFNKSLAQSYNIEDPYALVKEGKWTIDKLGEITKNIYNDLDGNGKADEADFYGYATNNLTTATVFLWSCDQKIITQDNDGNAQLLIKNEKTQNIVDKVYGLYYNNKGTYVTSTWPNEVTKFKKGEALFLTSHIACAANEFRDMDDDYGIIPFPKYDEKQEKYYTMSDGSFPIIAVPATITRPELVGAVTEALCAESWRSIVPAYYDVVLKVKGARDETSIEMLDLLMAGRILDFGYIFDGFKGFAFMMQVLMQNKDTNTTSYIEKKETEALKYYQNIYDSFKKVGE